MPQTSPTFETLLLEIDSQGVGVLTLNRPEKLNAFSSRGFSEMETLLDDLENGEPLRGLIITGSGRAFAAGADLAEVRGDGIEENRRYAKRAQDIFSRIEALPFPVVAAVNGYALGGGCELALACDIRIAGERAKFAMPEVSLGVIPCFGGTQRLPALIGKGRAKELIFTGKTIHAQEALEFGLVNAIAGQNNLLDAARELMNQMLTKSPSAIKYAKLAVDRGQEMQLPDGLELERELSGICYGLPDKAEGICSFFEKRVPNFPSQKHIRKNREENNS